MITEEDFIEAGFFREMKQWADGDKHPTGRLIMVDWEPNPVVDMEKYKGLPPTVHIGGMQIRITNRETLRRFKEIALPKFCDYNPKS